MFDVRQWCSSKYIVLKVKLLYIYVGKQNVVIEHAVTGKINREKAMPYNVSTKVVATFYTVNTYKFPF